MSWDGEWISVKDRLPEKSGNYLFYGDQYFVPDHRDEPDHCKAIVVGYWWVGSVLPWVDNIRITHWMPLPEPPEEVQG